MTKQFEYNRNFQDTAYLKMLDTIMREGVVKGDRTGTGTKAIHGYMARYDMSRHSHYDEAGDLVVDNFPLLTTKKMFMKGILVELLWFLRGETNIKPLVDKGVNIWNDWPLKYYNQQMAILRTVPAISLTGSQEASKEEFINAIKTDPKFATNYGELGPVYGSQWRAWLSADSYKLALREPNNSASLAEIVDVLKTKRIDQFSQLISDLKNNPYSRRHIVSAWNPDEIPTMIKSGLPPCHMMFQCMVRPNAEDKDHPYLDLMMTQRSADSFLGVPFNVASYAMLQMIIAAEVGMLPGTFIHSLADTHIYLNHLDQVAEQLSREPIRSPRLTYRASAKKNILYGVDPYITGSQLDEDDFVLENYQSRGVLKGAIAV